MSMDQFRNRLTHQKRDAEIVGDYLWYVRWVEKHYGDLGRLAEAPAVIEAPG
jgi:hypothetical protein